VRPPIRRKIVISRAVLINMPVQMNGFKRGTVNSTRAARRPAAKYLCVRLPSILTHRIPAHLDTVGIVNQSVQNAILHTGSPAAE
jgi:hypothetical protein